MIDYIEVVAKSKKGERRVLVFPNNITCVTEDVVKNQITINFNNSAPLVTQISLEDFKTLVRQAREARSLRTW